MALGGGSPTRAISCQALAFVAERGEAFGRGFNRWLNQPACLPVTACPRRASMAASPHAKRPERVPYELTRPALSAILRLNIVFVLL